jgi:hypothetical protein
MNEILKDYNARKDDLEASAKASLTASRLPKKA